MSALLIEKLKKARQREVTVDQLTFVIRRPTDMEVVEWREQGLAQGEILRRFVEDWKQVKEADLIAGGTPEIVAFDRELFMQWVVDQPQYWAPLIESITSHYQQHQAELEQSLKKPMTG